MLSLLLLMSLAVSRAAAECQAQSSPAVSLTVSSSQNQTGHRLIEAGMQSDVSVRDAVFLSVEQWEEHCGTSGTLFLKVRLAVPQNRTSLIPHGSSTDGPPATSSTTPDPVRPIPPPDYQLIAGLGYFKVSNDRMTWSEGRRRCESEGADMAVIKSNREAEQVYTTLDCCYWTGVYRENPKSEFVTVTGSRLNESVNTLWLTGYPSGSGNCVLNNYLSGRAGVSNSICSGKWRVICFYPS